MTSDLSSLTDRHAVYTPEFVYLRGSFKMGQENVPYYAISISVRDALKYFQLPRDLVFSLSDPINFEELYQRELDEDRVKNEIIPYLLKPDRTKFFGSFTVALLPTDPNNGNIVLSRFQDDDERRPPAPQDSLVEQHVGPIRIRHVESDPSIGRLSWNEKLVSAVILDGQHRFFSIKYLLFDRADYPWRGQLLDTELPVLLLVLDKRAGFQPVGDAQDESVLKSCRSIFIDLNKYAVHVKASRQYLLDDADLTAVSMRHILAQPAGADKSSDIFARVTESGMLPLAIVDWHSGKPKFDRGLYVTSTTTLYEIVQNTLDLPPLDGYDYSAIEQNYLPTLKSRLELDSSSTFDAEAIKKQLEECEAHDLPFELNRKAIRAAAQNFPKNLGQLITVPLTRIRPYRQILEGLEKEGFLNGEYEAWLGHSEESKKAFETARGAANLSKRSQAIVDPIKAESPLAFQVVFQKAFIASLVVMDDFRRDVGERWQLRERELDRTLFAEVWTDRFNDLFANQMTSSKIWYGAGLKANGRIDWSQASRRAISGFIVTAMLAPIEQWSKSYRLDPNASLDEEISQWLEETWAKIKKGRKSTSIESLLSSQGKYWRDSLQRYAVNHHRITNPTEVLSKTEVAQKALRHGKNSLLALVTDFQKTRS